MRPPARLRSRGSERAKLPAKIADGRRLRRVAGPLVAALAIFASAVVVDALAYPRSLEWEMARWINEQRRQDGLEPLLVDGPLTGQAQLHAWRMAASGIFEHSPWGELNWWRTQGWSGVSENVGKAKGGTEGDLLAAIHRGFLASPGHRANMLGQYKGVGVAYAVSGDGWLYVAQVYGDCCR